jgi:redox-sensitive bicupin YhaK (pirin superfamily)
VSGDGTINTSTGALTVNGVTVSTRDGATITGEESVEITATADAEVVLVDVTA